MKSEFAADREFVRGVASRAERVYVISRGKALMAMDIAHSGVVSMDQQGRWGGAFNTAWNSTAIAMALLPSRKVAAVGEDGDVMLYSGPGKSSDKEQLSPSPALIRNARGINGYVFACGMRRQVYKRVDDGNWQDISAPPPANPQEALGFEAIDGYSDQEVYAVGWGGEIWRYDGANWTNCDGPTNSILTAVCCAPDGVVYVGGQQGTLLRGRNNSWELIQWDDEVGADIWDLCWYQGKLYVATMQTLFTLEGNTLAGVQFGEVGVPTCYSLSATEEVLWSVGKDDIASFDGKQWRRYD